MKRTLAAAAVALLLLTGATPTHPEPRPVDPGCAADDIAEGAPLC